jgi:FMN-dependent NADH-azoreductase
VPHLLRLDSAITPNSRTRAITEAYERAWAARGPEFTVTRRDLVAEPLPHLTDAALHWAVRLRATPVVDHAAEETQARLLAELEQADVVLIGAPMYNYAMPSQLKVWLDHIHVPGVTAPFGDDTQPHAGTPAVLVTARGAVYDPGTPEAERDHVLPPLRLVLEGALGMTLTEIVTSRTLADAIPALDADRAAAELTAALAAAEAHARAV